jgi:hypothetical protein
VKFKVEDPVDTVHVLDFSQDGRPDLLFGTAAGSDGANRIFLNGGRGTFTELEFPLDGVTRLEGLREARVASADLNGDGLADLVVSGMWHPQLGPRSYVLLVYRKNWTGVANQYYLSHDDNAMRGIPNAWGEVIADDLDGDGDIDIVVVAQNTGSPFHTLMCFENRDGSFASVTGLAETPWAVQAPLASLRLVVPMDIDSDGRRDLLCFPDPDRGTPFVLVNVSGRSAAPGAEAQGVGQGTPGS